MNILLIMADQFAAHALTRPRPEDAHFRTPNLDRLAAEGTVFTDAYTPFPLCVPARSSLVTGRYPHRLGIMSNKVAGLEEPGRDPESLGHWFAAAGFDCAYAGKWHALQASVAAEDGFAPIHPFGDEGLVEACHDWLATRASQKPFLLVASFDDPHTICEYARNQPMPYGPVPAVDVAGAPPLPPNFNTAPYAAQAPVMEHSAAARMYGTEDFTADDWRSYRASYAALVERVDQRIGRLLDGMDLARTAVVFISDHGDGDASHRWNQKTALHQECIKVPFIVRRPGQEADVVTRPVPAVLGLLPTLCELAGIDSPQKLAGGSVLHAGPDAVVVATHFQDVAALPGAGTTGRAMILGAWKYTVYSWGRHREALHYLPHDPGEQRNLAVESAYSAELERMRRALLEWALDHEDTAFLKKLVLPRDAVPSLHGQIFAIPY